MSGERSITFGTCSWNYDSWVGLVYPHKEGTAAEYLKRYSRKYRTAEIDSWFYRLPSSDVVLSYLEAVDADFRFTCKVTNSITLTHLRGKSGRVNPDFLSVPLFEDYLRAVEPMLPRIDGIMFEFEYLNRWKMDGVESFAGRLDDFFTRLPAGLPLAVEVRNKNYLTGPYFEMLSRHSVQHVFSEKEYMPHVYDVFDRFEPFLGDRAIVRLLGGSRKEIEEITGGKWDEIVLPKPDLDDVIDMLRKMRRRGMTVVLNVNNHYEGSAPVTIDRIIAGLDGGDG